MSKFKTLKELKDFEDTSMWCVCGKLMTGLHMSGCGKLRKIRNDLMVIEDEQVQNTKRDSRKI
jgi:hypothetical protein